MAYTQSGYGAGAAGGAAALGLGSLAWPLLLAFGPALFSKLFGGDPQRALRGEIAKLSSPAMLAKMQGQFYNTNLQSPAYSTAQATIGAGANQTANAVASSLAARGIGTSGTGAVLSGLTPSLVGSQMGKLRTDAWNSAQSSTSEWLKAQIAALTGTQGPSDTQKYMAGGLEAFGPFLRAYLKSKYPQMDFGGGQ